MRHMQRILVFGATSAIAQAFARQMVTEGASIFCVGRNPSKLSAMMEDLKVRGTKAQIIIGNTADLNDVGRHADLLSAADQALGGVDAVLIAHGSLPDQKACEASVEATLFELQNNALNIIGLLTIVANYFEQRGSGVIAVISSVAGDRGRRSNYIYGAGGDA